MLICWYAGTVLAIGECNMARIEWVTADGEQSVITWNSTATAKIVRSLEASGFVVVVTYL